MKIYLIIVCKGINLKKINLISEIRLIIKGKGTQKIIANFSDNVFDDGKCKYDNMPDKIYINGIYQNDVVIYVYNLTEEINNVKIIYNNSRITNSTSMFFGLMNITSIDFSAFDSSNVIDMSYMFYNCYNLSSKNLNKYTFFYIEKY